MFSAFQNFYSMRKIQFKSHQDKENVVLAVVEDIPLCHRVKLNVNVGAVPASVQEIKPK
jgi:hypothetical protein